MKIAGVVVLYHPDEDVLKNIDTYITELDQLYVYDNSEKSHKDLFKNYDKVKYLSQNENMGIAYALNAGAKQALQDGYEWLLTMDQDSRYEQNELQKLIDYIEVHETEKIGLISPWHVIKTGVQKTTEGEEDVIEVMTSGNIVSLKAYQAVGGWKDWMFIDSVDIEFCMNLNVHGYRVIRLNYAELQHNLGNIEIKKILTRKFVCSNHNYIRRYYMIRNMLYVDQMYRKDFPEYCAFLRHGAWGSLKNVVVWEKDKYRKVRNMWRGYRDFKKGKKGKYAYKKLKK